MAHRWRHVEAVAICLMQMAQEADGATSKRHLPLSRQMAQMALCFVNEFEYTSRAILHASAELVFYIGSHA